MPTVNLSNSVVASAPILPSKYELRDTQVRGLFVRIRPNGTKTFELGYDRKGIRFQETIGKHPSVTVKTAREVATKRITETIERASFPLRHMGRDTLEAFIPEYIERCTLKDKRGAELTLHRNWTPLFTKRLADINRNAIETILSKMSRDGYAPATVNDAAQTLRGLFSRAIEWGKLAVHPMAGIKPLHVPDAEEPPRWLSDAERGRLYGILDNDCDAALATSIYIFLQSGMRPGELRGLRPHDIDRTARSIRVRDTSSKVAKSRSVPLSSVLLARLEAAPDWIAPPPTGHKWPEFAEVIQRAGISSFTPKDTRSDFCSRLARNGVPLHKLCKFAGHSKPDITAKFYVHIPEADMLAAIDQ